MSTRRNPHVLVKMGKGIVGLIALGSCLFLAQGSTAAISGIVRDATGAVVPGATVTTKQLESGLARTAVSSENGGYNVQFRAEAFNVFNHPNFASPNPVVFSGNNYSSSAGAITATSNASRQIQFALKLLF